MNKNYFGPIFIFSKYHSNNQKALSLQNDFQTLMCNSSNTNICCELFIISYNEIKIGRNERRGDVIDWEEYSKINSSLENRIVIIKV